MKTILVIEDNMEVRENVCEILELSGYRILSAEHGTAGIEIAIKEKPDLVLCDVMMPRLDGYGVLKILRANKLTNSIPFIFLTARVDKQDFRKGMGLGADDYITKPFDDTELLEAIETRLERQEKNEKTYSDPASLNQASALDEWIQQLKSTRQARDYKPKDVVYQESRHAKFLYYVESGLIREVITSEDGKHLITSIYGEGDFFGTSELVENKERAAETSAILPSSIYQISKDDFLEMLGSNRIVSKYFLWLASKQLHETKIQMLNQAYNSVRKKVADALLLLSKYSLQENEIDASRDDLAMIAGVAKETLIRTLSAFKSEKLISTENKKLQLINKSALEKLPQ